MVQHYIQAPAHVEISIMKLKHIFFARLSRDKEVLMLLTLIICWYETGFDNCDPKMILKYIFVIIVINGFVFRFNDSTLWSQK